MNSFDVLYDQYYRLTDKASESQAEEFATDLLQYGISKEYYNLVDQAAGLLVNFYTKYLTDGNIEQAVF